MSTLTSRRRVGRASVTAVALAAASLALLPAAPAQAAKATQVGGTAAWGISTYLNSANFGRPNPLPSAYAAPASFNDVSRVSSWGNAVGTLDTDGSASLRFKGASVNFTSTSGAWLKLADLQATLDTAGNGTVSALVSYGFSPGDFPVPYSESAPVRTPERVTLVNLAGNTAADRATAAGTTTWTGLDGTWDPAFATYLQGPTAATSDDFPYYTQINANPDRTPSPFTFTAAKATPAVTAAVTLTTAAGVAVKVDGTGFSPVTNPGDNGLYVGVAPSGGLPDVSSMGNQSLFAAVAYLPPASVVDGAFSRTLTATPDKLDPARKYSVYTWQAHTRSNTTQDTETPVTISWDALKQTSAVAATWKKKPKNSKKKGRLAVAVTGTGATPTGDVTLTLARKGTAKVKTVKATLVNGAVLVTLPKLTKGAWSITVAYAGDPRFKAGESAAVKVKVKKAKKKK